MRPLRHLMVASAALALSGCAAGIKYGDLQHGVYVRESRCDPASGTIVDGAVLPLFAVTSRLPDCREPLIRMLNHRADHIRYARIAAPRQMATEHSKKEKLTPLAFQAENDWWQALEAETQARSEADKGRVLLYVHGYRESFETTTEDAAQIARMTAFKSPIIAYSWPSQHDLFAYTVDETNMYWDGRNFRNFLRTLAEKPWVKEIVIVSHSMGARLVVPAIEYVDRTAKSEASASMSEERKSNISNIILASPDIDGGEFGRDIGIEILSELRIEKGRRITVYVSRKDRALATSRSVHGYPRLGSPYCFNPNDPAAIDPDGEGNRCYVGVDVPGLTIIDTSAVSRGFTGHSNFLRSAVACRDFVDVVTGTSPRRIRVQGDNVFRLAPDPGAPKELDDAICSRDPS